MTVEILGRSLTVTSELVPEKLHRVARMVDEQLRELQRIFPTSSVADLAILTALNLACEYLDHQSAYQQLLENYQQLKAEIEHRSRQLLRKLEVHQRSSPPGP